MKHCKSYREYLKIVRKYCVRNWHRGMSFLFIWVDYVVDTPEKIEEVLRHRKWCSGNLRLIMEELSEHLGETVYWTGSGEFGKLNGVEITNEDYYWIYEAEDRTEYESCVGGFEIPMCKYLKGRCVPDECSDICRECMAAGWSGKEQQTKAKKI